MNQIIDLLRKFRSAETKPEEKEVLKKYQKFVSEQTIGVEEDFDDDDIGDDELGDLFAEKFVEELSDDTRIQDMFFKYIVILAADAKMLIYDPELFVQVAEGNVTREMERQLALYAVVDEAFTRGANAEKKEATLELLNELRKFSITSDGGGGEDVKRKDSIRKKLGTVKYKKESEIAEFANYAKIILEKKSEVDDFFDTILKFYKCYYEFQQQLAGTEVGFSFQSINNLFDFVFKKNDPNISKIIDEFDSDEGVDMDLPEIYKSFEKAIIRFQSKFNAKMQEPATVLKHAPFFTFKLAEILNSSIFSESETADTIAELNPDLVSKSDIGGVGLLTATVGNRLLVSADKSIFNTIIRQKTTDVNREVLLYSHKIETEYEMFPDGRIVEVKLPGVLRVLGESLPHPSKLLTQLPSKKRNFNAPNFGTVGYANKDAIPESEYRRIYSKAAELMYPAKFKKMFIDYEKHVSKHHGGITSTNVYKYLQDISTPLIFLLDPIAKFEKSVTSLKPFYNIYNCNAFNHKFDVFDVDGSDRKTVIEYTTIIHTELIKRIKYEATVIHNPDVRINRNETDLSYIAGKLNNIFAKNDNAALREKQQEARKLNAVLKIQQAFRKKKNVRWSVKLKTSQNYKDYIASLEKGRCTDIKKKYNTLLKDIDEKYSDDAEVVQIKSLYNKKCK